MVTPSHIKDKRWLTMIYSQSTILVVDDDKEIVQLVRSYLEHDQFRVLTAHDGEQALHIIRRERPDLVVLDLMLPDRDGFDITRAVRADEHLKRTPIIMLTARVEDVDKLIGLEMGADDYITKPFNPREVVARVKTVLRRVSYANDDTVDVQQKLVCGGLSLDEATREVVRDDESISLTPTEFKILRVLMSNSNMVLPRADLMEKVFGYIYDGLDRTLDTHIRNIRKKIDPPNQESSYIVTVYGIGYRITEPDA